MKSLLATIFLFAPMQAYGYVVYDNFNRANEPPMGGNWSTAFVNGCNLTSQAVIDPSSTDSGCRWSANTFGADQFSQATISATTVEDNHAVAVRMSTSSGVKSYYDCDVGQNHEIDRYTAGVKLSMKTVTITTNVGDVVRCEVSGTAPATINFYYNDLLVGTTIDSSPFTSGAPGFFLSTSNGTFDNWSGGDLGAICQSQDTFGVGCQQ